MSKFQYLDNVGTIEEVSAHEVKHGDVIYSYGEFLWVTKVEQGWQTTVWPSGDFYQVTFTTDKYASNVRIDLDARRVQGDFKLTRKRMDVVAVVPSGRRLRDRFGLHNGWIRDYAYGCKNLWWFLNGQNIGYGDLSDEDIVRIQEELLPGEVFEGFAESLGRERALRKIRLMPSLRRQYLNLRITCDGIQFRTEARANS